MRRLAQVEEDLEIQATRFESRLRHRLGNSVQWVHDARSHLRLMCAG
jgi:hypothetical protein